MAAKPLVVITGASSGIGAEAARMFSAAGHPLLLLARRLEPMTRLALPDAMVRSADVTDAAAVTAAIAEAETRYGPTDLLINNAGMMALSPLAIESVATIQSMFDINCVAMLTVSQVVLPGMKSRRTGTIINIGSTAGKQVYDDHTVYNATKYAVHALTDSWGMILIARRSVSVTCCPGAHVSLACALWRSSRKSETSSGVRPRRPHPSWTPTMDPMS